MATEKFTRISRISTNENGANKFVLIRAIRISTCEIKIRATHKIMAARTTQFAFLVDQLVAALRTKPPVLAGDVFGRSLASVSCGDGICVFAF
jgi:hypothetical protein